MASEEQPVICDRRDEQDDRDARQHDDREVQPSLPRFQAAKPDREWQCEQEAEQDLHPESPDPQLLKQIDKVPVVTLFRCLTGAPRGRHRRMGLQTRRIRIGHGYPDQ